MRMRVVRVTPYNAIMASYLVFNSYNESPAGEEIHVAVLVMTAVIVLICLGILLPQVVGRKQ